MLTELSQTVHPREVAGLLMRNVSLEGEGIAVAG
jgi:hypothetical protein